MKAKSITYWTTTTVVMFVMTVSGLLALLHAPAMMTGLAHLGYPPYFSNLLGVAKIIGVIVVLAPGLTLFKEWAYSGFAIVVISAFYSHLLSGDGLNALEPLVIFAILEISYFTRPDSRRLVFPAKGQLAREAQ
ncbi:MAG: DoxX family protein [Capsulimonas sp.]|uniref:DoxX family protein n=1 Tax=Capsulimonas sp. TaxID=2494211 RepID=UPI003267859F